MASVVVETGRSSASCSFFRVSFSRTFDPLALDNVSSFQSVISVFSDLVASPSLLFPSLPFPLPSLRARFTVSRRWQMDEKRNQ